MIGTSLKLAKARFPAAMKIIKCAAQTINPVRTIERIISPQADRRVGTTAQKCGSVLHGMAP